MMTSGLLWTWPSFLTLKDGTAVLLWFLPPSGRVECDDRPFNSLNFSCGPSRCSLLGCCMKYSWLVLNRHCSKCGMSKVHVPTRTEIRSPRHWKQHHGPSSMSVESRWELAGLWLYFIGWAVLLHVNLRQEHLPISVVILGNFFISALTSVSDGKSLGVRNAFISSKHCLRTPRWFFAWWLGDVGRGNTMLNGIWVSSQPEDSLRFQVPLKLFQDTVKITTAIFRPVFCSFWPKATPRLTEQREVDIMGL